VSISPAGNHIAFIGVRNGTQQLYVRALDSPEAMPMAGTEGAYCTPTFSPDGQSIAFFDPGASELKKIALRGGSPGTLAAAGGIYGATWGEDDVIIYADHDAHALRTVAGAGGKSVSLTQVDARKGETNHRWPMFLPGGKAFLFAIEHGENPDNAEIVVQQLDTGQRRLLVQGGTYPQYVPTGYLAFVRGAKLLAIPFDVVRSEVKGQAITVSEDVQESGSGASQFGLSSQGSLVYVPLSKTQSRLLWVGRDGTERLLAARMRNNVDLQLSPDGRQVAIELDGQIWLYDLSRDAWTRLTFEGEVNLFPRWSPDGKWIAFESDKAGIPNVFRQRADGSGGLEQLTDSKYEVGPSSWSPDGRLLAFVQGDPVTRDDIWILRLSDRKSWPFLQTQFDEGFAAFSPDGKWLAYLSNESGRSEVYVRPFPGPGGKYQISADGGNEPAWNPKGKELFYRSGNKMMAVEVTTRPSFSASRPRVLFEGRYGSSGGPPAVSRDGQRFLMQQQGEAAQINVVLNWFEELKRRAPPAT
jgi:eukaryotic-like serine/threonine-protein kinase